MVRKDFTVEEIIAIKRTLEPRLREEAEKRIRAGRPCAESAQGLKGKTRDIVARLVGVSHDTLAKMERIVEAVEKDPETYGRILEAVNSGKMSVAYAYKMIKHKEVEPPPLPEGVFNVIYADPPWEYYLPLRGSPDMHYPTMPTEEICRLKVPAAEDAVLFLWATNPKLEDALRVMREWGFQYRTNMAWVKPTIGTGYYFRGQHELLLLGVRGKMGPPAEEDRPPSVLVAETREHSRKPEVVYEIIEKMYPQGRYLELFARSRRRGWVSWGVEVEEEAP
jgi:N6-adenosine-specific RNA methylase IME4